MTTLYDVALATALTGFLIGFVAAVNATALLCLTLKKDGVLR